VVAVWARVSTLQGPADRLEEGISMVNDQVIPRAKELEGFVGAYFLADRETGKTVAITLWDTEQHLRASEEAANRLRQDVAEATGDMIASVERFEVFAQA
jgi:heme-degrading monooxygenase HmoA